MSSTIILINNTAVPYRLNTKPITEGADPWPRETYFVQNIVAGPNQSSDIVEVNRDKHLHRKDTYILQTKVADRNDQVLFSLMVKVTGTLLSSDISAKIDNASGTKSTGWIDSHGSLNVTLDNQNYNIAAFWVTDFPSLFDNLEVHLKKA